MSAARILVVEDTPADIVVLRYALDAQGAEYELEVLSNGEEALQFVHEHRTGQRKPELCLILLDLHLPKYDGLEILRAIVQAPPLRHIRVLMMTGQASPAEQREIAELGAVFRKKPTSLEEHIRLAAEIIALCRESSLASTA